MVQLFGRTLTRQELQAHVGNMAQLGGIRPIELASGRERGVRGFDIVTGSGFEVTVLADRALDITRAAYRGRSLAVHTPAGQAHPAYFEAQGLGWLRTFPGGLVTTCGLGSAGAPSEDAGETPGLHGRISHLPAEELGYWGEWKGDEYWMHVTGTMTEGSLFHGQLRLTRHLSARLGGNSIIIEDTVENLGGTPAPHMMLYHCNLGFPLLSQAAQMVTPSVQVTPRDAAAEPGLLEWSTFQPPTPGYAEQVFYHEMEADNAGNVRVAVVNPELDGGLGVFLTYHKKSLPKFTEWKQMGYGDYALGLEPANCGVEGRAVERARGTLQTLQPGETRDYRLEIGILTNRDEIEAYTRAIKLGGAE